MRLRLLTLNVQGGEGDAQRQDVLNDQLRQLEPDLLALQEVLPPSGDEHGQLDRLLASTGLRGTHQAATMAYAPPFSDRYGGSAIACRWPYRIVEVFDPRVAEAPDGPWCTLAARVQLPDLPEALFIAYTGAWRLDAEAARERQALALTDLDIRHRTQLPTLIAGDFNADVDAASVRYLTGRQSLTGRSVHYLDAWEIAGAGSGHTWTTENPAARAEIKQVVGQAEHHRRLDYVLIGSKHAHPGAYCNVLRAELAFTNPVGDVIPSDHYGLLVEVDVGLNAEDGG
jgi:endonuclease/exonuclease/phosphatase family metal-dependent hydrolase